MDRENQVSTERSDTTTPRSTLVSSSATRSFLPWPLDTGSRKVIERVSDEFMPSKVMDLIWNNVFKYTTFFESVDGVTVTLVGTGTATVDGSKVTLTTTTGASDSVEISKTPLYQNLLSFGFQSRFRTNFLIDTITNHTTYIVVGSVPGGTYYGFKMVGDGTKTILYGVTKDGTTENTVQLISGVTVNTSYDIEARYIPKQGVLFLVNNLTPGGSIIKGRSAVNLPSAAFTTSTNLYDIKITNATGVARALKISFFEYIQTIVETS